MNWVGYWVASMAEQLVAMRVGMSALHSVVNWAAKKVALMVVWSVEH